MTTQTDAPLFSRADELTDWHRWQRRQQPWPRRLKARLRPDRPSSRWLIRGPETIHTLVALESYSPTQMAALVEPIAARPEVRGVAYLVPTSDPPALPGMGVPHEVRRTEIVGADGSVPAVLSELQQILAVGDYLGSGRLAGQWARQRGARFVVAQHGLLAHQAPPLPADCELLAFTAQDGAWWTAGRPDVQVHEVGLQILWRAATRSRVSQDASGSGDGPGVFLGQLHGAELPRADFARAALQYCRATGAAYRPHPAETDRLSRLMHGLAARQGVTVDRSGVPLSQTHGPVAAVFSTGVLEAAYAGRCSWVVHPNPPRWLQMFWSRYGLSRWRPDAPDPSPTTPPVQPSVAPAESIADHLFGKDQA